MPISYWLLMLMQSGHDNTRWSVPSLLLGAIRFKEAVNECTNALDAIPAYHKALVRRAKAYEQMGHFKQALSDIQKANKADTANPETQVGPPSPAQLLLCSAVSCATARMGKK